jgi:hypothetical protein
MKYGILIEIAYNNSKFPLKDGPYNEIEYTRKFLEKQGFKIFLMSDKKQYQNTRFYPTKNNVIRFFEEMYELILKDPNANIFFQYSGHGSQLLSIQNKKEADNRGEIFIPVDYFDDPKNNYVSDQQFNKFLNGLPSSAKMCGILECCNSQTLGNLPYNYYFDINTKRIRIYTGSNSDTKAQIVLLSSAFDEEYSYQVIIDGKSFSVMTYTVISLLNENLDYTILFLIYATVANYQKYNVDQNPSVSSSEVINNDSKFWILD